MTTIIKRGQQKLCLVHYEKLMFEKMYERLEQSKKSYETDLKNAILESFLIHTRNLIEFFQGTDKNAPYKKNCCDIIISDFINKKGEKFRIIKEGEWEITQEHKKKINKRLSHLSEERLNQDKDWSTEIEIFSKEIKKKFNNFVENLSNKYFPIECNNGEKFILNRENFKITINNKQNINSKQKTSVKNKFSISNTSSSIS